MRLRGWARASGTLSAVLSTILSTLYSVLRCFTCILWVLCFHKLPWRCTEKRRTQGKVRAPWEGERCGSLGKAAFLPLPPPGLSPTLRAGRLSPRLTVVQGEEQRRGDRPRCRAGIRRRADAKCP